MPELTAVADIRRVLDESRTIAVLGAHHERFRAAFYVPEYLYQRGYRVLGVNPKLVGHTLWGEPVVATLADLGEAVDLVEFFRRPDVLPEHLDELLALDPAPATVWFQLGIRHEGVARRLSEAGLQVVQDRCTLADHRALGLPSRR